MNIQTVSSEQIPSVRKQVTFCQAFNVCSTSDGYSYMSDAITGWRCRRCSRRPRRLSEKREAAFLCQLAVRNMWK